MQRKVKYAIHLVGLVASLVQLVFVPAASAQTHNFAGDIWTEADSGRIVRASDATVYLWPDHTDVMSVINSACVASKADMTSWMVARQVLNDTDSFIPVNAVVTRDIALLRSIAQLPHAIVQADSMGHFVFDSIPSGSYWIEAETTRNGKIVQWWKTTSLITFPFHIRGVDPSALSVRLGPLEFHPSQFCTEPEPQVGATAFVNDTPLTLTNRIYAPRELDKNVQVVFKGEQIKYPRSMSKTGRPGYVDLSFVVGTDGGVEMNSVQVIRSAGPEFVDAVKRSLATMRFAPAEVHGKPVRSRVEEDFNFTVTP